MECVSKCFMMSCSAVGLSVNENNESSLRYDYWNGSFNDIPESLTDRQGPTFRPEHRRTETDVTQHDRQRCRLADSNHGHWQLLAVDASGLSHLHTASFKAVW